MIKSSPYYKPKVKIGKFPSTLGGWINYYKTKGIQNPSDYAENMLLTLYYTRVVFLKYPELKRLPKDKTLSIFKAAKPLMSDQMARERRMLLDTLILESNR